MRDDSRRAPYLAHLRSLPFVKEAHLRQGRDGAILELTTPRGRRTLHVEEKTSHLSLAIVGDLLARVSSPARGDILILAPYVSPEMGTRLASRGINFVDREGNCSVDLGGAYVAHVEGRRLRPHADAHGGLRAPGFRLVFALLVDQDLLNGSARKMAEAAGVSLGTASNVVRRLEHERLVVRTKSKRHLVRREDLVERWIAGYSETLRPQLFFGRFETQDHDLSAFDARAASLLGPEKTWAWGGAAAAFRLTKHYRGDDTVLHVSGPSAGLPKRLGAIPHPSGRLIVLGVPGPLAFSGTTPHSVHPLLVYTELLLTGSDRAREAAAEIRERYLVSA
jgi:hypothetical protein